MSDAFVITFITHMTELITLLTCSFLRQVHPRI